MNESWLPVVGFEAHYLVSDLGRVRSLRTGRQVNPFRQTNKKYLRVSLYDADGKMTQRGVHQLVCAAFVGPANGLHVNHKDGDPSNNRLGNLEYLTSRENTEHARRLGLVSRQVGESNGMARLREDMVQDIKYLIACGFTNCQLGEMYDVTPGAIQMIRKGHNWRHVPVGPWRLETI